MSLGWHRTRGARSPLVARVAVAVALPRLRQGGGRGAGARSAHHVVPPAAPAGALGPGVVQCSKLLGPFLQPEQSIAQVADDQGTQEGFSTGRRTSPALLCHPWDRMEDPPHVVTSATTWALPAAHATCSCFASFGITAQLEEAP